MKIGFILDEIAPGSAPKLLGWPIRELKKIGVDAEAIVIVRKNHQFKYKEIYEHHLRDIKIRYVSDVFPWIFKYINFKFPGMSFFSVHHLASYFFAHRVVKKNEFQLIIAHCQYSTFAARSIKRKSGIPFITLIWDPSTFTADKIYKNRMGVFFPLMKIAALMLDRFALSKCEGVITSGTFHHPRLRHITNKPIHLLYPGCFPMLNLPPVNERVNVVFCFDRWDIGNDPELLLHVLMKMKNKNAKMLIGGFWHPESMFEVFKNKISKYGLSERVSIIGPLKDIEIERWASKAKVHLHAIHEAFGMQSLEVSACGCPSIIPRGSGVCELFLDGVSGYHPEVGDIDQMARYCDRLLDDFDFFNSMSLEAYKSAKQYSWAAHAKKIKEIADLTI